MGIVSSPLINSLVLKSIIHGNDEEKSNNKLSESLWKKALEAQSKRRSSSWQVIKKRRVAWNHGHSKSKKLIRRVLMKKKKRARLESSRRPGNVFGRKVKTLKKLIPNSRESMGLDGLFRETSDYILALQMRVKVMQIVVNALTGSDEE